MNTEFRKSGFLWNCPWLTKESCIRRRGLTEASLVYRSYINQAIRIVNDKLYRKAYLIRNEIKALEHAASFSTSPEANYESVCKVKSNLYTICIDTNEFVSSVLQSVSADHLVFQPHIKDLSRLMGIIYNEVLPNLSGTSKKGSIKVGQLIGKLVGYIEEIVELGHRVLEIQGAILVNGLDGMAPIKKPWWSGLLYDSDSFELMRLLSICIQHTLKELRSEDSNSVVAFWDFIIRTGYPLILFSHIIPTEVNMAAFEDLAYRLMEMSKRVKVRMHSLSDDPYPKFQIDYLTLTVSIPVPESEYHTLSETMDQNGGISLLPILFLPKHARKVTLTGIERDGKSSAVTDKALAINRQSLRILTIYVKKIEKFSASNASQIQIGGLYGDLSTGLQVLDSEIQGRVHAFYENPNEKDIQTTLLASRCLTKLTASISSRFFPSSLLQPLPSVWIQNDDTKNPAALFTVQDADFMFDKFGVSIDCNWCVA